LVSRVSLGYKAAMKLPAASYSAFVATSATKAESCGELHSTNTGDLTTICRRPDDFMSDTAQVSCESTPYPFVADCSFVRPVPNWMVCNVQ
jgi:hypothetical protein